MLLGLMFGLCSALGFGASAVFARLGLQHVRVTSATLVSLIVGTVAAMAIAFIFYPDEIIALSGIAFFWFLVSGALNFPVGRMLNFLGVSYAGVSRASTIIGASPLFATALAVTIGGETINAPIALGTAAIVGGLLLILSQR